MIDFIINIFNTDGFVTKGLRWGPELIALNQVANIIILLCYFFIPYRLYKLYYKKYPKQNLLRLFVIFISTCFLTKLSAFLAFYWPAYRLFIVIDWICAFIVLRFAYTLHGAIDYLLNIPIDDHFLQQNKLLEIELKTRQQAQDSLQLANVQLNNIVSKLTHILQTEMWLADKKQTITELSLILEDIRVAENVKSQ